MLLWATSENEVMAAADDSRIDRRTGEIKAALNIRTSSTGVLKPVKEPMGFALEFKKNQERQDIS
jgi:hypothetical protein